MNGLTAAGPGTSEAWLLDRACPASDGAILETAGRNARCWWLYVDKRCGRGIIGDMTVTAWVSLPVVGTSEVKSVRVTDPRAMKRISSVTGMKVC